MRFLVFLISVFLWVPAVAQKTIQLTMTKEEMVAKRKELLEAINQDERQLELLKNDKKATMGQLRALQNKLAERQRLIENINEEMEDIDNTIKSSSKEVVNLKHQLDQLKVHYAQSIRYAYATRSSYDMLAFLFSSHDFNDAMRRMKYLKKFREFRKQQVDQIRSTQTQLQHKIGVLNVQKKQKDELLNTQVQQKQVLVQETDMTNKVMQELKGKESELMRNIEKNRVIAKRVDKYINMKIQEEIAKANKLAEEEEKKRRQAELAKAPTPAEKPGEHPNNPPPASNPVAPKPRSRAEAPELFLTPTDIALANNFEGNKGKMYWPVEKGYITDHFGTHPHPLAPKVMINNTGIDIQTSENATVKAVFEGTVTSVSTVENMMVLIKHGDYFTVYNNLKSVSVKAGQHVSTNQSIGIVAPNDAGEPTIKFQIWKASKRGTTQLNPEQWIAKPR
jgi:septal ring factor EnvC (AmiA/AmiB activator)